MKRIAESSRTDSNRNSKYGIVRNWRTIAFRKTVLELNQGQINLHIYAIFLQIFKSTVLALYNFMDPLIR